MSRPKTEAERAAYWGDARGVVVDTGIVEYGSMMTGRGRWAELVVDGARVGVVWTDDGDNLGVTGVAGMDRVGFRRALDATRAMAAAKVPTGAAFDRMVEDYGSPTVRAGALEDLLA